MSINPSGSNPSDVRGRGQPSEELVEEEELTGGPPQWYQAFQSLCLVQFMIHTWSRIQDDALIFCLDDSMCLFLVAWFYYNSYVVVFMIIIHCLTMLLFLYSCYEL